MSDEELDKLFKNATEEFRADNDVSGWKGMVAMLDQDRPIAWYRRKSTGVIIASLFVVGTGLFWFTTDFNDTGFENPIEIKTAIQPPDEIIPNDDKVDKEELTGQTNLVEVQADPTAVGAVMAINQADYPIQSRKVSKSKGHSQAIAVNHNDSPSRSVGVELGDAKAMVNQDRNNSKQLLDSTQIEIDSIAISKLEESEMNTDSIASEVTQHSKESARGFSIKASIAPDFSSTELFKNGMAGFDFGLTTGYNFNSRWSLYTGVILARKIYSSSNIGDSYSTSGGYNYPIEKLDGDCRIIDIPLNVYYSFNQNRSLSLKVGIGLSSYIMLSEDYTYYLDKAYGSSEYSQRIENKNNEWFKMLNLSMILQKRLNDKLYLEVEPFIKIPITGIGEGDISLYSMGGFISLRYDFYRHEKR